MTNQITPYLDQFAFKAQLITQSPSNRAYYEQLIQDIFTRMCSELTTWVPKNYMFFVTWTLASGKGDLLHAIKVATIIRNHFPNNKVRFICEHDDSTEQFIREHGFLEKPIHTVNELFYDSSPCCVLEVATPNMTNVRADIASLKKYRKVHHIRIDEYNGWRFREASSQPGIYSSGIGIIDEKKDFPIGIHVDSSLKRTFAITQPNQVWSTDITYISVMLLLCLPRCLPRYSSLR